MGTMSQLGKVKELGRCVVTESAQWAQHNQAVHNHKDVTLPEILRQRSKLKKSGCWERRGPTESAMQGCGVCSGGVWVPARLSIGASTWLGCPPSEHMTCNSPEGLVGV